MKSNKFLFVLSSEAFVYNYIRLNALKKLSNLGEIYFLVNKKVDLTRFPEIEIERIFVFEENERIERWYGLALSVYAWRYRKRSKTFRFRHKREYKTLAVTLMEKFRNTLEFREISRFKNSPLVTAQIHQKLSAKAQLETVLKSIKRFFVHTFLKLCVLLFAIPINFWIFKKVFEKKISMKDELKAISQVNPDLVIFPNIAFGATSNEVARVTRLLGIKCLYLIENWDNLSSKSILWELPDFICTWGPQSNKHAVKIHNFKPEQIFNIGIARYSGYMKNNSLINRVENLRENPYILFLDTLNPFNVNKALSIVSMAVSDFNSQHDANIKIIYRPHPSSNIRERLSKIESHPFVELDVHTQKALNNVFDSKTDYLTPIDYLPRLLQNSLFVVGGLTSMIIEASLLRKYYIVLAHRERFNFASPFRVWKNYQHFRGIERLPNLKLCTSIAEVYNSIIQLLADGVPSFDEEVLAHELDFFYRRSEEEYSESLANLVRNLMVV
jgi:hypothetical protein